MARQSRLAYLRQSLADLDATFAAATEDRSWNAAVAAKAKAVLVREQIDELEQVQAASRTRREAPSTEAYYDELIATVRALRVGAMASGSHVAAVSALKLEGELLAARAAAADRAAEANRAARTEAEIEAEIERLRKDRGAGTAH